jgi:hypothetical protein
LPAIDRSLLALRARDFVARFDVPPSQTGELERDFALMWPVSAHWLPRALELLSSTDRVFAADARGARPLRVDAGTPFEFGLLVADGKPGVAVLTGAVAAAHRGAAAARRGSRRRRAAGAAVARADAGRAARCPE